MSNRNSGVEGGGRPKRGFEPVVARSRVPAALWPVGDSPFRSDSRKESASDPPQEVPSGRINLTDMDRITEAAKINESLGQI